jgi:hypothetical protein
MREDDEFWHYVPLLWTITAFAPDHHSGGGDHGGAGDRAYEAAGARCILLAAD